MSKYIKLTNKVHVPHILHLALYKNEKKQKNTKKFQDYMVLYSGLVVLFFSLVFLSLLKG